VLNRDSAYPNFRHALLLVAIALALQVAIAMQFSVLGLMLQARVAENPWSLGVMNLLALGLVLAWGRWKTGVPSSELFPLRAVPPLVWPAVLISQIGMLVVGSELDNVVRYFLPPPEFMLKLFADIIGDGGPGSFFTLVLVAPLTEEFMFRGLILRGLLRRGTVMAAVLLSALLFGLMHLNPWQTVTTTMMGVMLAWWTVRTRSLLPALAAHALHNSSVLWHRQLPFEITGFNSTDEMAALARFQPVWFDLIGAFLLVAGILWLHRVMPRADRRLARSSGAAPTEGGAVGGQPVELAPATTHAAGPGELPPVILHPASPRAGELPPVIAPSAPAPDSGAVIALPQNSFDSAQARGSHGDKQH